MHWPRRALAPPELAVLWPRQNSVLLNADFADGEDANGINQIIGSEPTAEFTAEITEEAERLLSLLPDESMRELALLKMEGYENREIAERLQCGLRTVERRTRLIRTIWKDRHETRLP